MSSNLVEIQDHEWSRQVVEAAAASRYRTLILTLGETIRCCRKLLESKPHKANEAKEGLVKAEAEICRVFGVYEPEHASAASNALNKGKRLAREAAARHDQQGPAVQPPLVNVNQMEYWLVCVLDTIVHCCRANGFSHGSLNIEHIQQCGVFKDAAKLLVKQIELRRLRKDN